MEFRRFTSTECETWRRLFERRAGKVTKQLHPIFAQGLEALNMHADAVPDLNDVNARLAKLTGFKGVPVEGLEGPESFFAMLARREYPIGNFIREPEDLSYTPAPDVFHDLYGHMPFFADADYADACEEFGKLASAHADNKVELRQFERLFWFTFEFALVKTPGGKRIFGAGIASSIGECDYSLSDGPDVRPFDPEWVRYQEYRIDKMQERLFILESPQQLYSCLDEFAARIPECARKEATGEVPIHPIYAQAHAA